MKATLRSPEVKAHLKRRQKEDAEKEKKRLKERAERTMRMMKRRAEQEFIVAGGDPGDFEDAWPELRDELLRDAVRRKVAETLPPIKL